MSVVTLAEAKTHLNISASTYDTEVQAFLDRCEAAISRKVGPLASTATTVQVRGCGRALVLPTTPAISLTSMTDAAGAALSTADLHLTVDGVVSWALATGWFGSPWYTVVYAAGRATLPDDLKLAVLELVRHAWATQRGAGGPSSARATAAGMETSNRIPGAAYMMPFRVAELIADHVQVC